VGALVFSRDDSRHHRRIGDPQSIDAVDAELRVDDAVVGRAHAAAARRVIEVLAARSQPGDPLLAAADALPRVQALAEQSGEGSCASELLDQLECSEHGVELSLTREEVVENPRLLGGPRRP
jgi:hypothetical protein